jgi:hypothetical protein
MIALFLAETIWQQQEGTLMSIEGSLSFIGTVLVVTALIGCVAMAIAGSRMARANRIARAAHDLIKALLEEQKKGNAMLQYLNDRAYETARGETKRENVELPTPNARSRKGNKEEPKVYRID